MYTHWLTLQQQTNKLADTQSQQTQQQAKVTASVKTLSDNQADTSLKLTLLQDQLQAAERIKKQVSELSADLDKLKSQSQGRDKKQLEIGSSIAQLEMTQAALVEQLENLETKLAAAPTQQQKLN